MEWIINFHSENEKSFSFFSTMFLIDDSGSLPISTQTAKKKTIIILANDNNDDDDNDNHKGNIDFNFINDKDRVTKH